MDFPSAITALDSQRLARITKIAIYALATIATVATLVLTEAAVIAWPIALPIIAVTLIAWAVFYHLNSHDDTYLGPLDAQTLAMLAKKELEGVFNWPAAVKTAAEIERTISDAHKLLGRQVFSPAFIQKITEKHLNAGKEEATATDGAAPTENPLRIDCQEEWPEIRGFGLAKHNCTLKVSWSGLPGEPLEVDFKKTVAEK